MLEARIQQHLFESADLTYQVADSLAAALVPAVLTLTGSLTAGGKVLVAAPGEDALARLFCAALLSGFERERPPLAALVLEQGAAGLAQLRALGQPGDTLLISAPQAAAPEVSALIAGAQAHDLQVVLLAGATGEAESVPLGETDVRITIPHPRTARVRELHLLALHALCDAIDLHLMGLE